MKDDSLDDTQFTQDVLKTAWLGKHCDYTANAYGREVWNSAIEAAADVAEINSAANIRKLKK